MDAAGPNDNRFLGVRATSSSIGFRVEGNNNIFRLPSVEACNVAFDILSSDFAWANKIIGARVESASNGAVGIQIGALAKYNMVIGTLNQFSGSSPVDYVDASGTGFFFGLRNAGESALTIGNGKLYSNSGQVYLRNAADNVWPILNTGPHNVYGGNCEIVTNGNGFILLSPNGTRYRIAVSNAGILSAVTPP